MDRRTFLKSTTAAATAGATTAAASAVVADDRELTSPGLIHGVQTINVSFDLDTNAPALRYEAERLLMDITAASQSTLRFEVLEAGAAGPDADAIITTDLARHTSNNAHAFFTGLPGQTGLSTEHQLMWLGTGGGQLHWQALAYDDGLMPLVIGHTGPGPGLWGRAMPDHLGDIRGTRFTISGVGADVVKSIGALPVDDGPGDWIEVAADAASALPQMVAAGQTVWLRDGLHRDGIAIAMALKTSAWERLSDGDRLLITGLAEAAAVRAVRVANYQSKVIAPMLFKARGVQVDRLPHDIDEAIRHAARQTVRDIATQNVDAARAFEAQSAFAKEMTGLSLDATLRNGAFIG